MSHPCKKVTDDFAYNFDPACPAMSSVTCMCAHKHGAQTTLFDYFVVMLAMSAGHFGGQAMPITMQATPGASFRPFGLATADAAKKKPQHRAAPYHSFTTHKRGVYTSGSTPQAPSTTGILDSGRSNGCENHEGASVARWGYVPTASPPEGLGSDFVPLLHGHSSRPLDQLGSKEEAGGPSGARRGMASSKGCSPDPIGAHCSCATQALGAWDGVDNACCPNVSRVSWSFPEQPAGVPIAPIAEAAPLIANSLALDSAVFDLGLSEDGPAKLSPPICQPAQLDTCPPAQVGTCQPAQPDTCQPAQNGMCWPAQPDICPPAQQQGLQQSAEAAAVSRCQFWARDFLGISSSGLDGIDPAGILAGDVGPLKEGPITECQSWAGDSLGTSLCGLEEMDPARSVSQAKEGPTTACQLWARDSLGINLSGLDHLDPLGSASPDRPPTACQFWARDSLDIRLSGLEHLDPLGSDSQGGEGPITACQLCARGSSGSRLSGLDRLEPLGGDSQIGDVPTAGFPVWGGDANGCTSGAHLWEAGRHGTPSREEPLQGVELFDAIVPQSSISHDCYTQPARQECNDPRYGRQQETSAAGFCLQPPQQANQGHASHLAPPQSFFEVANGRQCTQHGYQGPAFDPGNQLHVLDEEEGRLEQLQPAQQCPFSNFSHPHDVYEGLPSHGSVETPLMEPLVKPVPAGQKELRLAGLLHGLACPASGLTAASMPCDRLSALKEINSLRGLGHKHQTLYKTNLQVGLVQLSVMYQTGWPCPGSGNKFKRFCSLSQTLRMLLESELFVELGQAQPRSVMPDPGCWMSR